MNADLLVPGSSVCYLRGTTGECVPATVVGLSSFPECVPSVVSAQGIHNITAIAPWRASPSPLFARTLRIAPRSVPTAYCRRGGCSTCST